MSRSAIFMGIGIICLIFSILINFPRLMGSDDGSETESAEVSKRRPRSVSESAESSRNPKSDRGSSFSASISVGGETIDSDGNVVRERNIRISETGALPSGAVRELGLTEEEYRAVQTNLSEFWASMTEMYSKRVVYDEALSKSAGESVDCYRISALADNDRKSRMEGLLQELSKSSNAEIGEKIFRGLDECSSFGYFGKYDISLRFEPMTRIHMDGETGTPIGEPEVIPGDNAVKYVYSSPITGNKAVTGSSNLESVNELFGGIFKPGSEADFGNE